MPVKRVGNASHLSTRTNGGSSAVVTGSVYTVILIPFLLYVSTFNSIFSHSFNAAGCRYHDGAGPHRQPWVSSCTKQSSPCFSGSYFRKLYFLSCCFSCVRATVFVTL